MQLRTSSSIASFDKVFRKKFGFQEYTDVNSPSLFFGVYNNSDRSAIQNHKGVKIIWFGGSDSLMIKDVSFLEGATVVAESDWIRRDLDKLGIKHVDISLCLDDLYAWSAVSLGKSLYWYGGNSSKYGKQYLPAVRKAFPDLNIIIHDSNTVPREKMPEIYAHCFAGVRPVEHDGMSQTVCEMGLMGRMSIWNMKTPFSVPFEGCEGLLEAIKVLRGGFNPFLTSKRAREYFKEQETKFTNLILRLCNINELDATNIFDECIGKCGSIFRIQRKSDIEKIGGFGNSQFERPWFSEQMIKLGKKQFITSKNSGFIVTEWKNTDKRKGYLKEVVFNTHDRGTV